MPKQSVSVKLEEDAVRLLDERAEREGKTRTELIEFALEPLLKNGEVEVLTLPPAVIEMLDRIARGNDERRVDVMRTALSGYCLRSAERWQINALKEDKPDLKRIEEQIAAVTP